MLIHLVVELLRFVDSMPFYCFVVAAVFYGSFGVTIRILFVFNRRQYEYTEVNTRVESTVLLFLSRIRVGYKWRGVH